MHQYFKVDFNTYADGVRTALVATRDGEESAIKEAWWLIAEGEIEADQVQKFEGDLREAVLKHDSRQYRDVTKFKAIREIHETTYSELTSDEDSEYIF